jgi:hypothetical protein
VPPPEGLRRVDVVTEDFDGEDETGGVRRGCWDITINRQSVRYWMVVIDYILMASMVIEISNGMSRGVDARQTRSRK